MHVECLLIFTMKPIQSGFGEPSKAFNAVDMGSADYDSLAMFHSQVLAIVDVHHM